MGEGNGEGEKEGGGVDISVRNLRATRQGAKGFAFALCMGNEAERGVGG